MKLNLAKKTSLAKVAQKVQFNKPSDSSAEAPSGNGWMTRGRENIAAQVENVKINSSKRFAPEVFIKEGESKVLRFRSDEPIGTLYRYSLKVNGKWHQVTQPEAGADDPLREAGVRASLKALYEVIDIEGYVDKKTNKRMRMQPRFFMANTKVFEMLETIRKKKGGLTKFNIDISRSGTGTSTTYTLLPDDPSVLVGADKVPSLKNEVKKYYAPPSEADMRALASRYEPEED